MAKEISFPLRSNCIGFKYKSLIQMCKEISYEKTTENIDGFIIYHFIEPKYNLKIELCNFPESLYIYKNNKLLCRPYDNTTNFLQRIIIRFYLAKILKKRNEKKYCKFI